MTALDATLSGQGRQAAIETILNGQHRVVLGEAHADSAGEQDASQSLRLFQYPCDDGGEDAAPD